MSSRPVLLNMHANGVGSLDLSDNACPHATILDVSQWPDGRAGASPEEGSRPQKRTRLARALLTGSALEET
jgi:hypothetical protein